MLIGVVIFALQEQISASVLTAVLAPLVSAVAALFWLLWRRAVNREQTLEKLNSELEAENKSYLPLVVLIAAGNEESTAKLRRQAVALLEKQSGVDLGE